MAAILSVNFCQNLSIGDSGKSRSQARNASRAAADYINSALAGRQSSLPKTASADASTLNCAVNGILPERARWNLSAVSPGKRNEKAVPRGTARGGSPVPSINQASCQPAKRRDVTLITQHRD
jgi:hypothetical protein